ncbi:ATP1A1 [Cordylochernes scorpioides]|uniref:ATP1A1 n=1 Tax=Cordylochernes scorpioides TaxID=51811 RepID=A0ABY6KTN8_9ARAC|nr:ATP1A1 [Cordylochernes scorpioides]
MYIGIETITLKDFTVTFIEDTRDNQVCIHSWTKLKEVVPFSVYIGIETITLKDITVTFIEDTRDNQVCIHSWTKLKEVVPFSMYIGIETITLKDITVTFIEDTRDNQVCIHSWTKLKEVVPFSMYIGIETITLKDITVTFIEDTRDNQVCIHSWTKLKEVVPFSMYIGIETITLKDITVTFIEDTRDNQLYLGHVLFAVVTLAGLFSYHHEARSAALLSECHQRLQPRTLAIRDGRRRSLPSTRLVVGDVVELRPGDCVPADVVTARGLMRRAQARPTGKCDRGLVYRTGSRASSPPPSFDGFQRRSSTLLAQEIAVFVRRITYVAVGISAGCSLIALALGYTWISAVVFFIGLVVANVPEGLPPTVTVCLSRTAKRMANKNCLVKNLEAVETLGSTSVICSDMTGTLTQNRMTVSHIWLDGQILRANRRANRAEHMISSRLNRDFDVYREVIGDSTEAAILRWMEELSSVPVDRFRSYHPMVAEQAFASETRIHATVHLTHDSYVAYIKGAPEAVLKRCSHIILADNPSSPLTSELRQAITESIEKLGSLGERVIAFCDRGLEKSPDLSKSEDSALLEDGMRFLGLVGLDCPPRPNVPEAVARCRTAGIKVILMTGDHPTTAESVARSVGIASDDQDVAVCHGDRLRTMSWDQLGEFLIANKQIVFARTPPRLKLRVVEACKRLGNIVAATGQAAGDVPTLEDADVGIAMGITGCDIAKQAADIVLVDDNFASIVAAIEEGRLIFDNLKKSLVYTLTSNIPETTPFLSYLLLGIPLPLGTVTILCIDLVTDVVPAISLAYEGPESDLMRRRPRDPDYDKLVNGRLISIAYGQIGMIQAAAGFFAYFAVMAENGFLPYRLIGLRREWDNPVINDLADSYGQEWTYQTRKNLEHSCQTAFFVAIVVVQWADLIISKTRRKSLFQQGIFSNTVLLQALLFETLMAMALPYLPGMLYMLPIGFRWWLPAIPFAILILIYDEGRRFLLRKYPGGWVESETYY